MKVVWSRLSSVMCSACFLSITGDFLQVWLLRSVALEEQARQLLSSGAITAALHLAELCSGQGASWGQTAFAEAGFLLIHGAEARF